MDQAVDPIRRPGRRHAERLLAGMVDMTPRTWAPQQTPARSWGAANHGCFKPTTCSLFSPQGLDWFQATVPLASTVDQLVWQGTSGSSFRSDMAIDDVLVQLAPTPSPTPSPTTDTFRCPENWLFFDDICYRRFGEMNWFQCEALCAQNDATMLCIEVSLPQCNVRATRKPRRDPVLRWVCAAHACRTKLKTISSLRTCLIHGSP